MAATDNKTARGAVPPPGDLPRTYIPSLATKVFIVLVGVGLFVVAWSPVCLYLLAPVSSRSEVPLPIDILFGFGAICLPIIAVRFMKRALTAKVVWSGNFGFDGDFLAMPYLKSNVALVLLRLDRVM